jgi:hypothetical protein
MSFLRFLLWSAMAGAALAQTAPPSPPAAEPVPYASAKQVNSLLEQVQKTAQDMQADLSQMRIERWKTDANTRRSTLDDVESVQRNLRDALPEIIGQVRNAPESLPATFKLYRNLDALYDVFSSVAESAGAFGSKDEYQSLANDLNQLEKNRRSFAERMDTLANSKEGEITALRGQLHDAQAALAAVPPPPPKKVVAEDTEPPKPVKKKPKVPKPAATAQTAKPPASGPQTTAQPAPAQQQTQPH